MSLTDKLLLVICVVGYILFVAAALYVATIVIKHRYTEDETK